MLFAELLHAVAAGFASVFRPYPPLVFVTPETTPEFTLKPDIGWQRPKGDGAPSGAPTELKADSWLRGPVGENRS